MTYYVIGTDNGKLVLLCSKSFGTRQEAVEFADSCYCVYKAFVVMECDYD